MQIYLQFAEREYLRQSVKDTNKSRANANLFAICRLAKPNVA